MIKIKRQLFGSELKEIRKEKRISQYDLANGICSQSMLSFIESGKYIPNSTILVKLCERLGIDTDLLILSEHYKISNVNELSDTCEHLCNQHLYEELFEFLNRDETINAVATSQQSQAYYYYLGCAEFHLNKESDKCSRHFKLALAEAPKNTTLSRLCYAGLGLIEARRGKKETSKAFHHKSLINETSYIYEKNQNILFYLAAYSYLKLNLLSEAIRVVEDGIAFITQNDSHYMLGNMFYLGAKICEQADIENKERENKQQSELFERLFSEKIFKKISPL